MKRLGEMSKQEVEEIAKKQFLAVPICDIKDCDYAFPVSPEFCEVARIWHEALKIYMEEYFNESN